jgi:hypothetical protein
LRLAAWKKALRVLLSPELQQQTFEIDSNDIILLLHNNYSKIKKSVYKRIKNIFIKYQENLPEGHFE